MVVPTIVRNGIKLVFEDRSAGNLPLSLCTGRPAIARFLPLRQNTSPGGGQRDAAGSAFKERAPYISLQRLDPRCNVGLNGV